MDDIHNYLRCTYEKYFDELNAFYRYFNGRRRYTPHSMDYDLLISKVINAMDSFVLWAIDEHIL